MAGLSLLRQHRMFNVSLVLSMQELNYLASVTLNRGKVYALFVKSPAKVIDFQMPTVLS